MSSFHFSKCDFSFFPCTVLFSLVAQKGGHFIFASYKKFGNWKSLIKVAYFKKVLKQKLLGLTATVFMQNNLEIGIKIANTKMQVEIVHGPLSHIIRNRKCGDGLGGQGISQMITVDDLINATVYRRGEIQAKPTKYSKRKAYFQNHIRVKLEMISKR